MSNNNDDRFYLRQLKAGREFARGDQVATQMANFIYLIGDAKERECLVVDPAWDIDGILEAAHLDDMNIVGALVTHYHPDHVGGALYSHHVQGLARLMEINPCPVHVHKKEADGLKVVTGLSDSNLVRHDSGDKVKAGLVEIECLHTPGHTPGSQCFRCGGALVAGDTLFLQGCGRVDLPGGNSDEMWNTMTKRLSTLPNDIIVYPGHHYSTEPHASLEHVRKTNPVLNIPSLNEWKKMMG